MNYTSIIKSKFILLVALIGSIILSSCTPTYMLVVTGSEGGSVNTIGGEYDKGENVAIYAIPNDEYVFERWSDGSTENPRNIVINSSISLSAYFTKVTYDVEITTQGSGTIQQEILVRGGKTQYNSGTVLQITAIPQYGWEFEMFIINGKVVTDITTTIVVNQKREIIGIFKRKNPLYIGNSIIKAEDYAKVGDVWELNGNDYLVVDENLLRQMVNNNQDVTRVVTTKVTNMNALFYKKENFNQNISSWDTSNVVNFQNMFYGASSFNQPIGNWDTGKVTDMSFMFIGTPFNQPIGNWDTSNVKNMSQMFLLATKFNQNINSWDVSNVVNLGDTFWGASSFNQPLNNWDTGNVYRFAGMFNGAISFNQPINNWDMSSAIEVHYMFYLARSFNQPLDRWNVSNVVDMSFMFAGASSFNQDLSNWDVSKVVETYNFSGGANSWTLPKPNFN
jgi:surface protein